MDSIKGEVSIFMEPKNKPFILYAGQAELEADKFLSGDIQKYAVETDKFNSNLIK